ncbi:MAG: tRNA pseudouridine(38-40) synthase TruA [Gammaproteobacteria bacterium]|nr:tRNA pseudouridine(38-40) synthase TruA [Gammaproteobacteria bacterium]MCP5423777.1 tRNA pseudouridine(38-40) synthase TruA [Gammaproteobacteria bacterium]
MRIALGLEYDGSQFRGWQIQEKGVRTVQCCLEQALSSIADHPIHTFCAGRTDAGVHAIGQVVHFDTSARRPAQAWIMGGNSNLPADIGVLWAQPVPETFHARFSAVARRYRYVILNRPYRPVLERHRAAWWYKPLSAHSMDKAAQDLLGEHDFSAFRGRHCQARTPVRTVHAIRVERHGDHVVLDIEANAFLHHMVRNITGVLLAIGGGERPIDWAGDVLAGCDRRLAGVMAPPEGLYLIEVRYADSFGLPQGKYSKPAFGP